MYQTREYKNKILKVNRKVNDLSEKISIGNLNVVIFIIDNKKSLHLLI